MLLRAGPVHMLRMRLKWFYNVLKVWGLRWHVNLLAQWLSAPVMGSRMQLKPKLHRAESNKTDQAEEGPSNGGDGKMQYVFFFFFSLSLSPSVPLFLYIHAYEQ